MAAIEAIEATVEAEATVYAFRKNAREEVRASISMYRGYRVADLRVYFEGADGEPLPTRKGIAIRVEDLPELRNAVDALLRAAA